VEKGTKEKSNKDDMNLSQKGKKTIIFVGANQINQPQQDSYEYKNEKKKNYVERNIVRHQMKWKQYMKESEYSSKSEETALDLSIATELHRTGSNIRETFKHSKNNFM
jgi:hypothetical protein